MERCVNVSETPYSLFDLESTVRDRDEPPRIGAHHSRQTRLVQDLSQSRGPTIVRCSRARGTVLGLDNRRIQIPRLRWKRTITMGNSIGRWAG